MKLGQELAAGRRSFAEYCEQLAELVPEWGRGKVQRWIQAVGLEPERIAFLNIALCAVADDDYFDDLFATCFERHTRGMISALAPHCVVLCGKKQLEPYVDKIADLGPEVILTWHYRPMDTNAGKREIERVRTRLTELTRGIQRRLEL